MILLNDPTAVAVQGVCDVATGTITIQATNLTVTGAGSGVAFRSTGGQLCGGHVAVSSTLVDGVGKSADCSPGIGTASVAFSYSAVDLVGAGKVTGTCQGPVDVKDNFLADPKLHSPGTLRPLPLFNSPLVDAGDPAAPDLAQQPTDLAGLPRAVNGRRDVGALEYGRRAPSLAIAPAAATVSTGEPLALTATVSDPDPGDAVVVSWSFGDGGAGTGEEVAHTFSSPGSRLDHRDRDRLGRGEHRRHGAGGGPRHGEPDRRDTEAGRGAAGDDRPQGAEEDPARQAGRVQIRLVRARRDIHVQGRPEGVEALRIALQVEDDRAGPRQEAPVLGLRRRFHRNRRRDPPEPRLLA